VLAHTKSLVGAQHQYRTGRGGFCRPPQCRQQVFLDPHRQRRVLDPHRGQAVGLLEPCRPRSLPGDCFLTQRLPPSFQVWKPRPLLRPRLPPATIRRSSSGGAARSPGFGEQALGDGRARAPRRQCVYRNNTPSPRSGNGRAVPSHRAHQRLSANPVAIPPPNPVNRTVSPDYCSSPERTAVSRGMGMGSEAATVLPYSCTVVFTHAVVSPRSCAKSSIMCPLAWCGTKCVTSASATPASLRKARTAGGTCSLTKSRTPRPSIRK